MRPVGPVSLIGGGEHLPATTEIDRRLIELTGEARPLVVVLPQAPAPRQMPNTVALARNHWSRLGARVEIEMGPGDPELGPLAHADIAVIPGGHPNKLVAGLGASPILDLLVERWLDGMAVSGSSAGAMALFEWRIKLYPPNPIRLLPGLGLLDGYVAAPHFDRFRAAKWAHKALTSLDGLGVVGLDEATGMLGWNGRFEVLGSGSVTIIDGNGTRSHPSGHRFDADLLAGSQLRLRETPNLRRSLPSPLQVESESLPPVLAIQRSRS